MREREELKSKSKRAGTTRAVASTARGKRPASKKTPKKKKGGSKPPAATSPPAPLKGGAPLPPANPPANQVARERTEKTVKAPDVHDTAALAKLIRQDIQTALAAGDLPRAKYSVTTDKYSMGSSITVVATKLPFSVLNEAAFYPTKFGPQFDSGRFRSTIEMARYRFGDGRLPLFRPPAARHDRGAAHIVLPASGADRERLGRVAARRRADVPARAR